MANKLKIDIALPSKSKLQSELDSLLGKMNNEKIKVDFKLDGSSIKGILSELNKVKAQIGDFKILETGSSLIDGKTISEFVKIEDSLGNIVRLTEKQGSIYRENLNPVQKLTKEEEKYAEQIYKANDALEVRKMKLQSALDGLYSRGVVSESQLNSTGLDSMISNLNLGSTNTDFERINQILREQLTLERDMISARQQEKKEISNAIKEQLNLADKVEKVKNKYNAQLDTIEKVNEAFLKSSKGSALKTELENIRTEVNNLNPSNVSELNSQVSRLDSTIRNTSTDVSTMGREWSLATQNANTFTGAIGEALRKIGIFNIGYDIINGIENQFREGVQSVIDMDTALSNLNKVVDISKSEMLEMRDAAVSLGEELGRSAVDVAEGMAEFGRQYKDLDQIKEMTESSIIGANVMDNVTSGEVAKSLTTILTSMELEASNAIDVINKLNEVQNNFRVESGDMLNALAEVGSTAKTSGVELNDLTGYITALTVATGKSGDEVGTAIRSIMARMYKSDSIKALKEINVQVKDAEGNFRDFTSIMNDLDKVWQNLSQTQKIQTAQTVGGIQRYNDFISLVSNLDTAMEASATAADSFNSAVNENNIYLESIEGRMSSLTATAQGFWFNLIDSDAIKGGISLLESFIKGLDGMQQTFGSIPTAIGVASSAILMFTNNPLKKLAEGIAKNGLRAEELQSILNKVRTEMGSATTVSGKATAGIKLLGSAFNSAGVQAAILTVKTVALQAAFSMGLSLAITAVIGSLTKLVDSMITTKAEWKEITDECSANIDKNNELISSVETLMSKENQLNSELQSGKLTAEEQAQAREELLEVQKQIAQLLPESSNAFTSEGDAISTNTDKVLENLDAKKKLSEAEAIKMIGSVNLYDSDVAAKKYEEEQKKYEELMEAYKKGEQWNGLDVTEKMIEKSKKKIDEYKETIETDMKIIETLRNSGWTDEQIASRLYDKTTLEEGISMLGRTEQAWGLMTQAIEENTNAKKENSEVQPITEESALEDIQDRINEAEITTQSATDIMNKFSEAISNGVSPAEALASALNSIDMQSNLQDATKTYAECINEVADLHSMLKELNEEQELTPSIISKIALAYPEVGASVTDLASLQDFLQNKINETMQKQSEAYAVMIGNDTNYYASKIANNSEFEQLLNDSINSIVGMQTEGYDIDLSNFATLNELKNGIQNQFGEAQGESINSILDMYNAAYTFDSQNFADLQSMKQGYINQLIPAIANWIAQFTGGNAEGYTKDLSSFNDLAEMKTYAISQLSGKMADLQAEWSKVITSYNNAVDQAYANGNENKAMELESQALRKVKPINEQINRISAQLSTVDKVFGGLQTQLNTYEAKFTGATFGGNVSGNKGSSSNKGSSDSSSSTEKEVEDISIKIDGYYKLNDVLEDYNNLLDKNKLAQEHATPEQLNNLIAEEISLMEKKKKVLSELTKAYQSEANQIKNTLSSNGFLFDSYGNLINSQERLAEIMNWINSSTSGSYKEEQKENLEALCDLVERYTELCNTEIPKATAEFESMNNSIKDIAVEKLTDLREELVDALKVSIEADKESEIDILDARIEELQKQIDDLEDSYEDKVKKKAKLEAELLKWQKDDSVYSIKKQKEIQEELDDLNKEIKKEQLELEIENVEKEKQEIEDIYDKKLEEKNLYYEADRLLAEGHIEEIKNLLEGNSEDFKSLGNLLGEAFKENFMSEIELALESLKLLKGEENKLTNSNNSSNTPTINSSSTPSISTNNSTSISTSTISKGSKVKISDIGATIYKDSYTSKSSGTVKGAGVKSGDGLYIVNDNNGRVAVSRTNSIKDALFWIPKSKVSAFDTGGYTGTWGDNNGRMAILHQKERVLSAEQTASFERLVDILPLLTNNSVFSNIKNASRNFVPNSELGVNNNIVINNEFNVETKTDFEAERFETNVEKMLIKDLRRFGRIKTN